MWLQNLLLKTLSHMYIHGSSSHAVLWQNYGQWFKYSVQWCQIQPIGELILWQGTNQRKLNQPWKDVGRSLQDKSRGGNKIIELLYRLQGATVCFIYADYNSTFIHYKTKPNLQVKAKKRVCITSKLLLFSLFFFAAMGSSS